MASPAVPPIGAGAATGPWSIPAANGPEWSVGKIDAASGAAGTGAPGAAAVEKAEEPRPGGGFGEMLGGALADLQATQDAAAQQATALATGQTQDITAVVSAVEQASLSMHLAAQLRNKAVEAYTEIFRTQV